MKTRSWDTVASLTFCFAPCLFIIALAALAMLQWSVAIGAGIGWFVLTASWLYAVNEWYKADHQDVSPPPKPEPEVGLHDEIVATLPPSIRADFEPQPEFTDTFRDRLLAASFKPTGFKLTGFGDGGIVTVRREGPIITDSLGRAWIRANDNRSWVEMSDPPGRPES